MEQPSLIVIPGAVAVLSTGPSIAPFILGLAIGSTLLLLGGVTGYFFARRQISEISSSSGDMDQRSLLKLLHELSQFTRDYRGGVQQFQTEVRDLTHRASSLGGTSGNPIHPVVQQILETSRKLQTRLDAAERQLAAQTEQLESYLNEARTDGLTGLANRRAFDKKLDELFAKYTNGGSSFVVALVDVDHFKKINDTYGHPTGDSVLREVARRLSLEIEETILVARYGGEEFAVLLPSPLRMAAARLDNFRKVCAETPIKAEDQLIRISVSVGLSEVMNDTVPGPLIRRADESLYAAKGVGRNRTYYHDGKAPVLFGAPELA